MIKTIVRARETQTGIRLKTRVDGKVNYEEIDFPNYFYVTQEDFKLFNFLISENQKYFSKIEKVKEYVKIFFKNNWDRWRIKSKFEIAGLTLYEADLKTHERYLINEQPDMNSKGLKWLMYDIETKDDSKFSKDINGNIIAQEPVLSIAYKDCDGYKYFMKNQNKDDPVQGEIELLKFHNTLIDKYDIILGWNSKGFDDTYIKQRSEFHRLNIYNWEFINQVDYMLLVKKYLYPEIESYSLDFASQEILGDQKLKIFEKGNGGIYRLWLASFEGDTTFEDYNKKDVSLMFDMEEKLKFINLAMETSDYTKCFIQEILHNSNPWDLMLLQDFKNAGLIAPSKPSEEEKEKRKRESKVCGAYTFCDYPGVYEDAEVYDFKSFYPTTGTACNICFTTLITKEEAESRDIPYTTIPSDRHYYSKKIEIDVGEKYFRLDKRGIIADRFDELINLREKSKTDKWKYKESDPDEYRRLETKEWMFKILANSGYGVLALRVFRFFNEDVANAITQFCRYLNKQCKDIANNNGFKVIQGDTDSLVVINVKKLITKEQLEELFKKFFDKFAKKQNINSKLFKHKDGSQKPHYIVFEWEKTFDGLISVAGKNYAVLKQERDTEGNPVGDPKVSITGLECKKKNTNPLAKKLQRQLIDEVLLKTTNNRDEFIKTLELYKEEAMANKLDVDYLIMQQTLQRPFTEYGKDMIDSKTGLPKLNKDGEIRKAPIPAPVKLAMRMEEAGKEVNVGDLIQYIVKSSGPIVPMTIDEYKAGEDYDREYYWEKIITPVLKVILVTNPEIVLENYKLWRVKEFKNDKQLTTFIEKLKTKMGDDD